MLINYVFYFKVSKWFSNQNKNIDKVTYCNTHPSIPSILLINNQATVPMSKNYKVTAKNRHIAQRWHFVRQVVKEKLFLLQWIPAEDQLANNWTKIQVVAKLMPHFQQTLIKVPDKIKGFRSTTIGNQ